MDSLAVESQYDDITVVTEPSEANLIFDSVEESFFRFLSWSASGGAYHARLDSEETITLRKYLHQSNRYYFVQSESFRSNE